MVADVTDAEPAPLTDAIGRLIPPIRAWFRKRLRNAADVDDAVQDVWLRTVARLDRGDVRNPDAYLFQVAQSVLTDRARRAAVRHEHCHDSLQDHHHPVEGITPERVLLGKQALGRVAERLAELPERTRDIFVLHRFENMSYGEIAGSMGISVSAVEKHMMKALRALLEGEA